MAKSSPEGIELGKGSTLIKMEVSVGEKKKEEQYTGGLEMGQIIPKEEPKNICIQTGLPCGMQCLSEETCNSIRLKQETLEEAKAQAWIDFAKTNKDVDMYSFVIGFNKGYKLAQERMYSEMDIVLILSKFRDMKMIAFSEWFEKFKK